MNKSNQSNKSRSKHFSFINYYVLLYYLYFIIEYDRKPLNTKKNFRANILGSTFREPIQLDNIFVYVFNNCTATKYAPA